MADRLWFVLLGMCIIHSVAAIVLQSWGFGIPAILLGIWLIISSTVTRSRDPCP